MQPLVPDAAASPPLPRPMLAAIAALTALTTMLGLASTASALWALVAAVTLLCVVTAIVLTERTTGLRQGEPGASALVALLVVSASALMWNAVYAGSVSGDEPVIPIFHWLFTLVPALLSVAIVRRRSRHIRVAAALSTGVVTLPLFALGWSLLVGGGVDLDGVTASLWLTVVLGVSPFIAGVALAGERGGDRLTR